MEKKTEGSIVVYDGRNLYPPDEVRMEIFSKVRDLYMKERYKSYKFREWMDCVICAGNVLGEWLDQDEMILFGDSRKARRTMALIVGDWFYADVVVPE